MWTKCTYDKNHAFAKRFNRRIQYSCKIRNLQHAFLLWIYNATNQQPYKDNKTFFFKVITLISWSLLYSTSLEIPTCLALILGDQIQQQTSVYEMSDTLPTWKPLNGITMLMINTLFSSAISKLPVTIIYKSLCGLKELF